MRSLFICTLILLSFNSYAQTAMSFRFGTTSVKSDDYSAYGTGWQFQGETFLDSAMGAIFAFGQNEAQSSDSVNQSGTSKAEFTIKNTFLNLGMFYYITEPLRVSGGLSFNKTNTQVSSIINTTEFETELLGPFASISYMLRLGNLALGAEYFYTSFGDYTQSNLIFILGLSF